MLRGFLLWWCGKSPAQGKWEGRGGILFYVERRDPQRRRAGCWSLWKKSTQQKGTHTVGERGDPKRGRNNQAGRVWGKKETMVAVGRVSSAVVELQSEKK